MTVLSGCTQSVVTKTNYIYPPAAYLVQCERSEFSGKTYADAIDYLMIVIKERDLCASQVNSIRDWQAQTKAGFK
ncbi:hypothetical protein ASU4_02940 [Actinobacillus suis]|nr:hypothetical protein ASU5_04415 [Actinobacillus suis]OQS60976.1 hypothetical protein ASU4_02940 [Actinobacillus suis]